MHVFGFGDAVVVRVVEPAVRQRDLARRALTAAGAGGGFGEGRVVAEGDLHELLAGSGTRVRGLDPAGLATALSASGLAVTAATEDALTVDATPEQVGRAAAAAGQVLLELRAADGAGLEELFFSLTAGSSLSSEVAA